MKAWRKVLGLLLLAAALPAGAQGTRFTLAEAVGYGVQNSSAIRAKALALEAARQELASARAGYYPSLSAALSYTHLAPQPGSPGFYLAAGDALGLAASLSQSLYTFGKLAGGVRLAELAVAQAQLDLREERRRTVMLIRRAFDACLLALEVQGINRETLGRKQEALEVALLRYQAGQVADYEVLRAESDLENYRATVIGSDNAVRVALLNVRDALGIREESFDFELELVGELAPLAFALERQALLARALQDRYELAGFRGRLALLKAQQGLDRSLALPTLAGFVGYSLDSGFDPASGASRWFEAGAWSGSWNAGLSLSVPLSALLPWSKESAAQRRTALQLENLNVQYAGLESGARIAVESGLLKVAEQEARIASGRKGLALAQRLYESAEEQYRGGYISSTDLKDAQLGLNGAQLALAQAVFAYNQNVLELMDAAGMDGEQEP
jgi:outer membrane protein TolC